jgi:hypothetical protein
MLLAVTVARAEGNLGGNAQRRVGGEFRVAQRRPRYASLDQQRPARAVTSVDGYGTVPVPAFERVDLFACLVVGPVDLQDRRTSVRARDGGGP